MRLLTLLDALIIGMLAISPAGASEYRSLEVKHEFQRQHPCPSTGLTTGRCPGYIKDHVVPLDSCGCWVHGGTRWCGVIGRHPSRAASVPR
jgi:hypothetical protein